MQTIRNIYCVGRNYVLHVEELGNELTQEPLVFMKPTHSLVPIEGKSISLPGKQGEVHFEAELILHVGKAYSKGSTVDDIVDKFALGIDFTLRDVQSAIKKKGTPWLPAKGFLNSAPISDFHPFPGFDAIKLTEYSLLRNGVQAQRGNLNKMIYNLQVIIDFIAERYGLGAGDIIFTGTPQGVAAVNSGDRMELLWGEQSFGTFTVDLT
jgi:fumarylpyruvate hydrolase